MGLIIKISIFIQVKIKIRKIREIRNKKELSLIIKNKKRKKEELRTL